MQTPTSAPRRDRQTCAYGVATWIVAIVVSASIATVTCFGFGGLLSRSYHALTLLYLSHAGGKNSEPVHGVILQVTCSGGNHALVEWDARNTRAEILNLEYTCFWSTNNTVVSCSSATRSPLWAPGTSNHKCTPWCIYLLESSK